MTRPPLHALPLAPLMAVIGYVSLQRGPGGDITAVQHKVTGFAPQPQEFVVALRWMADAVEIESLPEAD